MNCRTYWISGTIMTDKHDFFIATCTGLATVNSVYFFMESVWPWFLASLVVMALGMAFTFRKRA